MDKKVFLAISLCAAIFLVWQNVYLKPYTEQQARLRQEQAQQAQATAPTEPKQAPSAPSQALSKATTGAAEEHFLTLGGGNYVVTLATRGGVIKNVALDEYRGQKAGHLDTLVGGSQQLELMSPTAEWNDYFSKIVYSVKSKEKSPEGFERLVLVHDDEKASIQRTYTLNPSMFTVDHDVTINFKQSAPGYVFVGMQALRDIPKEASENERRKVHFKKAGGHEEWDAHKIDELKEDLGDGQWLGFSSRYFLNALVDRGSVAKPQFQARPAGNGEIVASLIYKTTGSSVQIAQRMYYGPKDTDILKDVGGNLQAAVDFGWFTIFALPMLKALKWFYKYVHNYGVAIILLTLLVKAITYPLTLKSMKSMKHMQRIQPQMARLREKYADDKEKLNREMLQLMRANGYNPASGCLPMFIQMPIFVALYNVLYNAIDLYGQPFFGWIHNLSLKDPFYVTPILLALMMFLQQKVTPNTATDPAQQRMMMMMPVIFGFMMLWLPSGLTLYMLVNSVVSILQQFVINRQLRDTGAAAAA